MEDVKNTQNTQAGIQIRNLSLDFPLRKGTIHALNKVDFDIPAGKVTALVGESGSGKSTLATTLLNNVAAPGIITEGEIRYNGKNILDFDKDQLNKFRWEKVSMVFQGAQNVLNPLQTVFEQFFECYHVHYPNVSEEEVRKKTVYLLEQVRLDAKRVMASYPHELSGGMKQRVMIAFALLLDAKVVILDEPTTALDVITQDYIFNILSNIHKELGITMLIMTHDIAVLTKIADRVGVMYGGYLMEVGSIQQVFNHPLHPYSKDLVGAAPSILDELKERPPLSGTPLDLFNMPEGCAYCTRCTKCTDRCLKEKPELKKIGEDHYVACHRVEELNDESAVNYDAK